MIWLAIVLGGALVLLLIPGSTPRLNRKRHPNGLCALERVTLNGTRQWVSIRSEDVANPVVLFVHGGPGTSMLGLTRRDTRSLEARFTVVAWDQRGAGKSFAAGSDAARMCMRELVADLIALAALLSERFQQPKIVLVGHSWGSAIGVLAVAERPDLFAAYIGIGQVSSSAQSELLSYNWTLQRAQELQHAAGLARLRKMGPPPYTGARWRTKLMAQRSLLARYGGEVYRNRLGAMPAVLRNVCSREYTLLDRLRYFRGILRSLDALGPELSRLDLFTQAPRLRVPVYFCLGRHDYEVPSALSAQYFAFLQAPYKQLVWFEESAHMPNTEQPEAFNQFMLHSVWPNVLTQREQEPRPAGRRSA